MLHPVSTSSVHTVDVGQPCPPWPPGEIHLNKNSSLSTCHFINFLPGKTPLQVRRLAVVLMNNLLAVPSLAGTGRQAIAALGGPAALRPMLALTPTTDPPSRERQQLEQLIAALIA